jgi:hypothetical protein
VWVDLLHADFRRARRSQGRVWIITTKEALSATRLVEDHMLMLSDFVQIVGASEKGKKNSARELAVVEYCSVLELYPKSGGVRA